MSDRKAELTDAALDYLIKHGIADLSLRPLAEVLGTSARMLLFYFGSKEGLIQAVLQELQNRLRASFVETCRPEPGVARQQPIKLFWEWAKRDPNMRCLRLLYEVQVIAAQNPEQFGSYVQAESSAWQNLALEAMSSGFKSRALATLCIAVFDGLFLELMTTGCAGPLDAALDVFIALASGSARGVADPSS